MKVNGRLGLTLIGLLCINTFLRQDYDETTPLKETIESLGLLLSERKGDTDERLDRRESDKQNTSR